MTTPTQAPVMSREEWTNPFHDVQHYGECLIGKRWATVTDWGDFAELICWTPGCGFRSPEFILESAAAARKAGEDFVSYGVTPKEIEKARQPK